MHKTHATGKNKYANQTVRLSALSEKWPLLPHSRHCGNMICVVNKAGVHPQGRSEFNDVDMYFKSFKTAISVKLQATSTSLFSALLTSKCVLVSRFLKGTAKRSERV